MTMVNMQKGDFDSYKAAQEKIILELKDEIEKLKTLNEKLNTRVDSLEEWKKHKSTKEANNINIINKQLFSDLFSKPEKNKPPSEPISNLVNIISTNEDEKKRKQNNVIIFGLNIVKEEELENNVNSFLSSINIDKSNINKIIRMNKRGVINPTAPIKLITHDLDCKYRILKAAKQLQSINQTNKTKISISQDLTEIERINNKAIINERNKLNDELRNQPNYDSIDFYYGIRKNQVIQLKKTK